MNLTLHSTIHRFINRHCRSILCLFVLLSLVLGSFTLAQADSSLVTSLSVYRQSGYNSSSHVLSGSSGTIYVTFNLPSYATSSGSTFYIYGSLTADNPGSTSSSCQIRDGGNASNVLFYSGSYDDFNSALASGIECTSSGGTVFTFAFLTSGSSRSYDLSNIYISDSPYAPATPLSYSFDNGYLMVVDVGLGSSYDFSLSSISETYSTWLSGTFPDTNQSYWFTDTLPTADDSIPPAGDYSLVVWERGDSRNIFGQSYEMVSSLSGVASNRYLCIYNPPVHTKWSNGSNPSSNSVDNNPVTVSGLTNQGFWIFDTSAQLVYSGTGSNPIYLDATIVGDYGLGVISGGAITVVDTSGNPYVQTPGGSTDISGSTGGTLQENVRGLQQTLNDLVDSFTTLFASPVSHIQKLIESGGNFFSTLSQLFTWLPAPVQTVLGSSLALVLVIGVIKLLL